MAIFGRAGAAMIPMLNAGRDGLEAMKREADQLGIVIDGKTGKSAEQFNDNITRLTSVLNGIFVQITARTVPALENITNAFVEVAKNGQSLEKMGEAIAWVMQKIAHASLMGAELIQQFGRVFQAVAEASSKIARGEFGAAIAEFGKMTDDIALMEKKYKETLERLYRTRSAWEQNPPLPPRYLCNPVLAQRGATLRQALLIPRTTLPGCLCCTSWLMISPLLTKTTG
jgi:methyl-accepting chemotaxis protein